MNELQAKINDFFQANQEALLSDLEGLMKIKSKSEDRTLCEEALRYAADIAEKAGMKAIMGKYGDVCVVEVGKGDETLGILAHVDVVDEGARELWECEPFTLTQQDGLLLGRGIIDDKGPVIGTLYALKFLKENVSSWNKRIWLIIGSSEETEWIDMEHFKEEFPIPDYGYSPDGNFPIFNAESGYMDVVLDFRNTNPKSFEHFEGGVSENVVPASASFIAGGKRYDFHGKSAHSSTPELGENAILNMAEVLCKGGWETPDFAKFLHDKFPKDNYESLLCIEKAEGIQNEKSLPTTIVPTLLMQEDDKILLNFNVRQTFEIPGQNVIEAFEKEQSKYHYHVIIKENLEPIFVDENKPWLLRMKQAYEAYGKKCEFMAASGCTYAKTMPNFVTWGPVFPEDIDCAHMENEQISLESFMLGNRMYTYFLFNETGTK